MAEHYTYAIGRRKSATAKVRLTNGKGAITVNGVPAATYFADSAMFLVEIEKPSSRQKQMHDRWLHRTL